MQGACQSHLSVTPHPQLVGPAVLHAWLPPCAAQTCAAHMYVNAPAAMAAPQVPAFSYQSPSLLAASHEYAPPADIGLSPSHVSPSWSFDFDDIIQQPTAASHAYASPAEVGLSPLHVSPSWCSAFYPTTLTPASAPEAGPLDIKGQHERDSVTDGINNCVDVWEWDCNATLPAYVQPANDYMEDGNNDLEDGHNNIDNNMEDCAEEDWENNYPRSRDEQPLQSMNSWIQTVFLDDA